MGETTQMKVDNEVHDRLMTPAEAADYLSVTPQTLRVYERDLGLPVHRLGDGPKAQRRFYLAELDEWVRSRWTANAPAQTP